MGYKCDIEETKKALAQKKAKQDKKGKGNIKKTLNEKAE